MKSRIVYILLAGLIGCSEYPTEKPVVSSQKAASALIVPGDERLDGRARLRAISDSAFARSVRNNNLIVIVGFKPETLSMGVGSHGESLVAGNELGERSAYVASLGGMVTD